MKWCECTFELYYTWRDEYFSVASSLVQQIVIIFLRTAAVAFVMIQSKAIISLSYQVETFLKIKLM